MKGDQAEALVRNWPDVLVTGFTARRTGKGCVILGKHFRYAHRGLMIAVTRGLRSISGYSVLQETKVTVDSAVQATAYILIAVAKRKPHQRALHDQWRGLTHRYGAYSSKHGHRPVTWDTIGRVQL